MEVNQMCGGSERSAQANDIDPSVPGSRMPEDEGGVIVGYLYTV